MSTSTEHPIRISFALRYGTAVDGLAQFEMRADTGATYTGICGSITLIGHTFTEPATGLRWTIQRCWTGAYPTVHGATVYYAEAAPALEEVAR
jgi:hypothetical protein